MDSERPGMLAPGKIRQSGMDESSSGAQGEAGRDERPSGGGNRSLDVQVGGMSSKHTAAWGSHTQNETKV